MRFVTNADSLNLADAPTGEFSELAVLGVRQAGDRSAAPAFDDAVGALAFGAAAGQAEADETLALANEVFFVAPSESDGADGAGPTYAASGFGGVAEAAFALAVGARAAEVRQAGDLAVAALANAAAATDSAVADVASAPAAHAAAMSTSPPGTGPTDAGLTMQYYGFNYADYYNGEYAQNDRLADVRATGANSVALTPDWGIDIAASQIYAGGATTDTTADLTLAIHDAADDDMTSFVRPLIDYLYPQASPTFAGNYYVPDADSASDPSGFAPADVPAGVTPATVPASAYTHNDTVNYRGQLSPKDINVTNFFGSPTTVGSYDWMIVSEAKVAAKDSAALFSVGTEMDSLATNPAYTSDWTTLIADVRAVYSGKLTYSANWGSAADVGFWSDLDYVGIDGYVPLSNVKPTSAAQNPSLATLVDGWTAANSSVVIAYSQGTTVGDITGGKSAIDFFDNLAQQSKTKQFIFTELGYQNDSGAANDPTGGSQTHIADPTLQAELYQAFFNAWGGAQATAAGDGGDVDGIPYSLAGVYFWAYNPNGGAGDNWQPTDDALAVIDANFPTKTGPVAVPETNSAGVAGFMGSPKQASGTAGTSGSGLLAGVTDPTSSTLSITAVSSNGVAGTFGSRFNTEFGSLELSADGSYSYFANPTALASAPTGKPITDVIDYTITDGNGATANSTLTITDYRDPTTVPETGTVVAGGTLSETAASGVLKGDVDPDGAGMVAVGVSTLGLLETSPIAGAYGTLTLNSNGAYSYVADSSVSLASDFAKDGNADLVDLFNLLIEGPAGTDWGSSLTVSIVSNDFTGGGAKIDLAGAQGNTVFLFATDNKWDFVTGSNGAVNLSDAQAQVTGGGDTVNLLGSSGNQASLYGTSNDWDYVAGADATVDLTDAQTSVDGGGDVVDFLGSAPGNGVSLYDTANHWDFVQGVSGASGEIFLNDAQTSAVGGSDTFGLRGTTGNAMSLYDTDGHWDQIGGADATIYLTDAQTSATGGGEAVYLLGASGDQVSLYDSKGVWDYVSGGNGTVYLTDAEASVAGGGDAIYFEGSGDAASLYDTANQWDYVDAANSTIYLTSAESSVVGGGDVIDLIGAGDAVSLYDSGNDWGDVTGANATIYFTDAEASVVGGGNTIVLRGTSGNAASLYQTGGVADNVSGSDATLYLTGARANVTGTGETIVMADESEATVHGGSQTFEFQAAIGQATIGGFNATDKIEFAAADFASFAAMNPSHVAQVGANTVITYNANNTVTLNGVSASSLTAAEFRFV